MKRAFRPLAVWSTRPPLEPGVDIKRNGGNPPRVKQGFVEVLYVRCPDCEIGDDVSRLRNDGGAVVIGGGQLKGSTRDVGVTRASAGCPMCRGRGAIPTNDLEALMRAGIDNARLASVDPYALKA